MLIIFKFKNNFSYLSNDISLKTNDLALIIILCANQLILYDSIGH